MIESLIFVLILLQLKHWYVDFVIQTDEEIKYKGIYFDWRGLKHSVKHGLGTFLVLLTITGWAYIGYAFIIACMDVLAHYHIDWVKMNYGEQDNKTTQFWDHFGLDQMAHQLCYIILAGLVVT